MTLVQTALSALEILLLLVGAVLLGRLVLVRQVRDRWLLSPRLVRWPVAPLEFLLFLLLMFNVALFSQAGARALFGDKISSAADREGLEVIAYGFAFHSSSILCWLLYWAWRRSRRIPADSAAPEITGETPPPPPAVPVATSLRIAFAAFAAVIPVLLAASWGWTALLRRFGLPDERQDIIDIFTQTQSPAILAGIALLAIVIAPLNEELLFRAGVFRFARDRASRPAALLLSSVFFAALHANLASFLPLVLLGVTLALAYEKSGSLVSSVALHALFNLNTTLIVLSGLPELSP